jgi:hypothetical protein
VVCSFCTEGVIDDATLPSGLRIICGVNARGGRGEIARGGCLDGGGQAFGR